MIRTAAQIAADIRAHDEPDTLTADQRYLLGLVADGHTHQQIARKLDIPVSRVHDRLPVIYRRLGAHNAPHAVAIAIRAGLLPAPDPGAHQQ